MSGTMKTYNGNCHCGAFKFHTKIPELKAVLVCNCSLCSRKGFRIAFITPGSSFVVERGEGTLKEYEFANKQMVLKFCGTCGTGVMAQYHNVPKGMGIMINANTLMDVDLWSLKKHQYPGDSVEPRFVPHPFTGQAPVPTPAIANPKTYTGSCHCGAITVAMTTKGALPEGGEDVLECDCSICTRNGTVLIYPTPDQVSITNEAGLTSYSFGRKFQTHDFCSTCGVAIRLKKLDVGEERWKAEHPTVDYAKEHLNSMPLNLRIFEGVEWEDIKIPRGNWSKRGPKYVCPDPE